MKVCDFWIFANNLFVFDVLPPYNNNENCTGAEKTKLNI